MSQTHNQSHLEVLTSSDAGRWREVLEEIGMYDFYHLHAFHRLAEIRDEGEAVMPVFREAGYVIAFPMLFRDIDLPVSTGTGFKDATSVRGFAGPLVSPGGIPEEVRLHFQRELHYFFEQNRIISAYGRLNPLTCPPSLLEGCGKTVEIGVTVSIDLTLPPDVQFARYRKHVREDIRRLKRMGFSCEEVGPDYLGEFVRIYHDTMRRVHAEPVYFYDDFYFHYLIYEMSDVIHLFVCKIEGVVASAGICAACGGIVEGLLSGTASEYLPQSPAKLLHHTRREWGSRIGAKVLHFGGGSGAKRDSLYDFKMGFGGREHVYSTWRHIVNQKVYDEICREVSQHAGIEPDLFYFPRYRNPCLQVGKVAVSQSEAQHGAVR